MKFLSIITLVVLSCNCTKNSISSGKVILKKRYFDFADGSFKKDDLLEDIRMWYYDSLVIQETRKASILTVNNRSQVHTAVDKYVLFDLKRGLCYEFGSFTDTAAILNSYKLNDSNVIPGGWNFLSKSKILYRTSFTNPIDTVIENVSFKMLTSKYYPDNKSLAYITMGYLRCDLKSSLFQYDREISEKYGCPLVRVDMIVKERNQWMKSEIEFCSEVLSKQEISIIYKWKSRLVDWK